MIPITIRCIMTKASSWRDANEELTSNFIEGEKRLRRVKDPPEAYIFINDNDAVYLNNR